MMPEEGVISNQILVAFILPGVIFKKKEGTEQTRRRSAKNQ